MRLRTTEESTQLWRGWHLEFRLLQSVIRTRKIPPLGAQYGIRNFHALTVPVPLAGLEVLAELTKVAGT